MQGQVCDRILNPYLSGRQEEGPVVPRAPLPVACSQPLFLTPYPLNNGYWGWTPGALLLFLPCGPPLSLTRTIMPKAVGDQVPGQDEPTLSWGGGWRELVLILLLPGMGCPSEHAGSNPKARQKQEMWPCSAEVRGQAGEGLGIGMWGQLASSTRCLVQVGGDSG